MSTLDILHDYAFTSGVEQKFKSMLYPVLISPNQIKELTNIEYLEDGIKFGAAVPLSEIVNILKQESLTRPGTAAHKKYLWSNKLTII